MHLGNPYPYLSDLWACSSQFWPGWVPRKLLLSFDGVQAFPWLDVGGLNYVSLVGAISVSRESVDYELAPPPGYDFFHAYLQTAEAPIKGTVYSIILRKPGGVFNATAGSAVHPSPAYGILNDTWPDGTVVSPNTSYVPPVCTARAALWGEV